MKRALISLLWLAPAGFLFAEGMPVSDSRAPLQDAKGVVAVTGAG